MNRDDLAEKLARLKDASGRRITIVRVIVDPTGKEVGRLFRGTFVLQPAKPPASGVS